MLADQKLKAFVASTNAARAKLFYKDILGLKLISEDDYGLEFEVNAALLRVAVVEEFKPQTFTVLGWKVDDISSIIESLNDKSIFCEKYDFVEQDHSGIWTSPNGSKVAWFKDFDGNVLSISQ